MKVEEIKLAFENNQKFELSLVNDVKKVVSEYFTTSTTAYSKTTGALNSLREALSVHNKAVNGSKQLNGLITKIEATAKELGVSPKDWEMYTDALNAQNEVKRNIENIKGIQKAISLLS